MRLRRVEGQKHRPISLGQKIHSKPDGRRNTYFQCHEEKVLIFKAMGGRAVEEQLRDAASFQYIE